MARLVHRDAAEEEEGDQRRRGHDNNYVAYDNTLVHKTIDVKVAIMLMWSLH